MSLERSKIWFHLERMLYEHVPQHAAAEIWISSSASSKTKPQRRTNAPQKRLS